MSEQRTEALLNQIDALIAERDASRAVAAAIYKGFELESLNGVVCSIPDEGLDTKPHRTWCVRCQARYRRLKALGSPDVARVGGTTAGCVTKANTKEPA